MSRESRNAPVSAPVVSGRKDPGPRSKSRNFQCYRDRLRALMIDRGLTQSSFTGVKGATTVHRNEVRRAQRGELITHETARRIAAHLGVPVEDIGSSTVPDGADTFDQWPTQVRHFGFGQSALAFAEILHWFHRYERPRVRVITFTLHQLGGLLRTLLQAGAPRIDLFHGTRETARRLGSRRQFDLMETALTVDLVDLAAAQDDERLTIGYFDCPPTFTAVALNEDVYWINHYVWTPRLEWLERTNEQEYKSLLTTIDPSIVMPRRLTDSSTPTGDGMPSLLAARVEGRPVPELFESNKALFEAVWAMYEHDFGTRGVLRTERGTHQPFLEMQQLLNRVRVGVLEAHAKPLAVPKPDLDRTN